MVDADLLVGAAEIAHRLGYAGPQSVHYHLTAGRGFPEPVAEVGGGPNPTLVWYWPDVEAWAKRKWPRRSFEP